VVFRHKANSAAEDIKGQILNSLATPFRIPISLLVTGEKILN